METFGAMICEKIEERAKGKKILQRNRYVLNSDQDVEDDDFLGKKKREIFRKKK